MSAADLLLRAAEVQDHEVWPEPLPLDSLGGPTPIDFPLGKILPPALEDFAAAFAERLRVPVGIVAMSQLCVASAAVGGRATIAPDRNDCTWIEPSALWVVGVMGVSSHKTPILKAALAPLHEIERELRQVHEKALREYEEELEAWQRKKAAQRGPKPAKPVQPRLLASDCTREALADLLVHNPGLLAYQDELAGLFRTWNIPERGPERSFYVSAYSGTPAHIDRIQRGASYIERPTLSLLGFIQPGPFRNIVREAFADGAGADGLLQRFAVVTGELLPWVEKRPAVTEDLMQGYHNAIRDLYLRTQLWPEPRKLEFDDEAQDLWYGWQSENERARRDPDISGAWEAYLGKRMGLTARLALVLGLLHGQERRLDAITLTRAIALVKWLEPHARRVWTRALNGDTGPAIKLAGKLQRGELDRFTERQLAHNNVAGISTAAEAKQAVEILVEANWIIREGNAYRVNPRVRRGGGV